MSVRSNKNWNSEEKRKQVDFRINDRRIMIVIASLLLIVGGYQAIQSEAQAINLSENSTPDGSNVQSLLMEVTPVMTNTSVIPIIQDTAISPELNPYTYEPILPDHQFIN